MTLEKHSRHEGKPLARVGEGVVAPAARPRRSSFALTSGMDFSGKTVNLVDPPEWAQGASVVDGNIVLAVKPVA